MNKFKFAAIFSSFLFILIGCTNKLTIENKMDVYAFTKDYEQKTEPDYNLNQLQKKSIDTIINLTDILLSEEKLDLPKLHEYTKKNNMGLFKEKISYLANGYKYLTSLDYGSKINLSFSAEQSYDYVSSVLTPTSIRYSVEISHLNTNQCFYLKNHYKYEETTWINVVKTEYNGNSVHSQRMSCEDLNAEDTSNISIFIGHEDGYYVGKEYDNFKDEIYPLINKQYETAIKLYNTHIYFTDKKLSYKDFRNGVDYVINPKNNHVIVGSVDKNNCKRMLYNLAPEIKYTVNEKQDCKNGLNQIEFFK